MSDRVSHVRSDVKQNWIFRVKTSLEKRQPFRLTLLPCLQVLELRHQHVWAGQNSLSRHVVYLRMEESWRLN